MIPVRVAQEKNTRNTADSTKRCHCGAHRMVTLKDQQRLDLLEIFEERYRRKSTLITAQLPVAQWHDMIGEPPSPMLSSTGSSTTPTVSPLKATACEGKKPRAP